MKKSLLLMFVLITLLSISCTSVQPMSESTKLFVQETNLSTIIPLQLYSWLDVENAKRVRNDILSGRLDFEFDANADFLLKTEVLDNKINSVWGKQLLIQNTNFRQLVFTSLIAAIYALENEKDPFDVSFEVIRQILAEGFYNIIDKELDDVLLKGLIQYFNGGISWENYKKEHFFVENKTITIK